MITDDVRRETAKRLREKKKEFFGERSWFPQDLILYQSMYLTAIDECLPDGECGFDVLADLIEPEPVTGRPRTASTRSTSCTATGPSCSHSSWRASRSLVEVEAAS